MKQFTHVVLSGFIIVVTFCSHADAQTYVYPNNGPVYNRPHSVPDQSFSRPPVYRNDNSAYDSNDSRYNGRSYDRFDSSYSVRPAHSGSRLNDRSSSDRRYDDRRSDRVIRSSVSGNSYGARSRVDRLASDLYREANDICWEMNRHYQRNSNYNSVYREIYDMKEVAKKMQTVVRQQNGRHPAVNDRIADALHDMDRRFHEFEADIRRWRPDSNYTPRQELYAMIADCEDTLHEMMDDYGVSTRHGRNSARRDRNEPRNAGDRRSSGR